MKCAHLFNGIGGFALAAHWMGWENYMHCEIDPFCNKVMNKHFSNSIQHEDIRKTDFTGYRGTIDLLTGGFPCQQTSLASAIHGKRTGLEGIDSGLWREQVRVIQEIEPAWVVVENVAGAKKWKNKIIGNLEGIGYTVSVMEGSALHHGLPHFRRRMLFIANRGGKRLEITRQTGSPTADWFKRLAANGSFWLTGTPGTIGVFNGLPNRVDRIRALGNAVNPQVAHQIYKAIEQYNAL